MYKSHLISAAINNNNNKGIWKYFVAEETRSQKVKKSRKEVQDIRLNEEQTILIFRPRAFPIYAHIAYIAIVPR